MPSTYKNAEQLELSYTADGNAKWYGYTGKKFGNLLQS